MKKKTKKKIVSKKSASKSRTASAAPTNKTGITPLGDRVIIRPLTADELENKVTTFGIIIPDAAKEKPEQGIVVAVGPGRRTDEGAVIAPTVNVGDRVMFSKYGYDEIKVHGQEYFVVTESNILAVITH
jgi:chaperonin GroES